MRINPVVQEMLLAASDGHAVHLAKLIAYKKANGAPFQKEEMELSTELTRMKLATEKLNEYCSVVDKIKNYKAA